MAQLLVFLVGKFVWGPWGLAHGQNTPNHLANQ